MDGEHLTATVGAAQLASAGLVQVSVRSPAPGSFKSNTLPFIVDAAAPIITSLSPVSALAGSPTFVLTVNGSNFPADAQVLWNGAPLATQVVNAGRLTAQVNGALWRLDRRLESPYATCRAERISPALPFVVEQLDEHACCCRWLVGRWAVAVGSGSGQWSVVHLAAAHCPLSTDN